MKFENKNILVIGGSRGIGREAVKRFTQEGGRVAFTYLKSEIPADELRRETGAIPIRCDVKFSNSVKIAITRAIEVLGHIDILICNAGISDFNLVTEISEERWEEIIDTDLNGVFYCCKYVLPSMISRKSGCILTISSIWGQEGASCEAAYSAAKAGVIGLTKAIAKEVGPSNIRVNSIAPGMIDTDMMNGISEDAKKQIVEDQLVGRIGQISDVVNAMEFLTSEDAAFITGQVIAVNGGWYI
ncbi:MAG: 3-oxoacyl-ACP reductase FabG [Clostridiales bacterium]|nr:3-oxoacyl-ACP reductase FabG [Clostridiales bacterium]